MSGPFDDRLEGIKSVHAAFAVIEAMAAAGEPRGVTELAGATGMPKPRVFRYLSTLRTLGYVEKDGPGEKYRLTLKLFRIGEAVADATPFTVVARPAMIALRNETGQTVALSEVEADGVRVLDLLRAHSPVQIVTRPGALLGFDTSAQGLVALAFRGTQDPARSAPATRHGGLAREVEAIRARGWAVAPGGFNSVVNALAAPVVGAGGKLIGTIAIVGTLTAIPAEPAAGQVEAVLKAARTISEALGGGARPDAGRGKGERS